MDLALSGVNLTGLVAMAGGGVSLDFDNTVILQAVLFTVLLLVLKPLLFDPVLRIFALREERTEGVKASARELQERAVDLLEQYQREFANITRTATEERERLRAETTRLETEILREAREATTRIIDEGRRRIEAEVNAVRFQLGRESQRAAELIVDRVLSRRTN